MLNKLLLNKWVKYLLRVKCWTKYAPGPWGTHILISWLLQLLILQKLSPESVSILILNPTWKISKNKCNNEGLFKFSEQLPHIDYQWDALTTQSWAGRVPSLTNKTGGWQSSIMRVWGQDDTHQMTTHPTCYYSDWRRRLLGMPTSLGTWCLWNWCIDHQGRTWVESGERMCLNILGACVPFLRHSWRHMSMLPCHPKVRHLDDLVFSHEAISGSLE